MPRRRLPLLPMVVLVLCAAFVTWCASRTFHIGRMPLPRSQAVALALTICVTVNLFGCWLLLGWRAIRERLGWRERSGDLLDRRGTRAALLALLALLGLLLPYGAWIEPRWVAVRKVAVGGTPPAGQRAPRIAVISDLHVDGPRPPWTKLAERVNSTDPDVVVFLGDSLNHPAGLGQLRRTLAAIKARRAKLAVRGNWEAWYWSELPLLRGTGFSWLDGRRRKLRIAGQSVCFVGLGYRDGETGRRGQRLLRRCGSGWRIFLYHTPDLAERVTAAHLYLAGHTHGGQVALPLFGALVTLSRFGKRFERGLSRAGKTAVYVNPGIGVEPMIPLRLGVRPEVTLIRLGAPPKSR